MERIGKYNDIQAEYEKDMVEIEALFEKLRNSINYFENRLTELSKQYIMIMVNEREVAIMMKMLIFDMDGTIADLYGVEGWLADLRAENTRPYEIAKPMYNMVELTNILNALKKNGWTIAITSWLSKGGSKEYNKATANAKLNWLKSNGFPYDETHFVKYGTTKANCTRKKGGYQILIDDNEKVRAGWKLGSTINANEDIIEKLVELLLTE